MAEPLKNQYGPEIPRRIAAMIAGAWPEFAAKAFVRDCLEGYDALELTARARHITRALRRHLPDDYPQAVDVLVRSLGPPLDAEPGDGQGAGMGVFVYLPHVYFVAEHGLDHLEESLAAQHALTQRFTAEFSIRPFLQRHPEATLARLHAWTRDPSHHVRRLVSEGTRPRLPWAGRLRAFQRDPAPVLALLEKLKDDPSLYVRRSVANNLNDIGKDHPALLAEVARRWLRGATPERRWVVEHALRSAIKRGDKAALGVLGFGKQAEVHLGALAIEPARVAIGGKVRVAFEVTNTGSRAQAVLVDLRVGFVKADGSLSPKVFKLKQATLAPGGTLAVAKTVSLAEMTTRRHYPGRHTLEAVVNGEAHVLGGFDVTGVR